MRGICPVSASLYEWSIIHIKCGFNSIIFTLAYKEKVKYFLSLPNGWYPENQNEMPSFFKVAGHREALLAFSRFKLFP